MSGARSASGATRERSARDVRQELSRSQAAKARPDKPSVKRTVRGKRRRVIFRVIRVLFVMLCFALGTFLLTSLITGNTGRIRSSLQGLITPGMPKLVIRDTLREYKIAPLNQKDTRELRNFLNIYYEDNQGIVALNSESAVGGGTQSQSPLQKQLTKMGYTPKSLNVTESLSQMVSFPDPPDEMEVLVFFQGEMNASASLSDINALNPDVDGLSYALVEATWASKSDWQTDRTGLYCFAINFDRPARFSISAEDIDPGELLIFYAEYLCPGQQVSVTSNLPLSLQFAPYGRRQMIALAPIDYDIHPGSYPTVLSVGGASQSFDITVKDKEFAIQYVSIDPKIVAETRTEETNKEFLDKVTPMLTEQLPELRWLGKAALPVPESKVLTLFGSRRYVNDDVNSYRHTGLDLEAPVGTEVKAVNNGKVLFAEYLAYTGNTILIEHGLGLKSWYYHLNELLVRPGDTVLREDVIGLSGQTGFAAQPHLHLTMSVGDKYINPVTAFNQPLFKEPLP